MFKGTVINSLTIPYQFKDAIKEAIQPLIENADKLQISEIWLFGSCASGKVKIGSDVDILVIPLYDSQPFRDISYGIQVLDIEDDIGIIPVDMVVRSRDYIESGKDFFSREVLKYHVKLWERGAV